MQETVLYVHIGVSVLLILLVLVQDKGVGFGTAVGGSGGGASFYSTQRGAAKVLHRLCALVAVLFVASALVYVALPVDQSPSAVTPDESPSVNFTTTEADSAPVEVEAAPTE